MAYFRCGGAGIPSSLKAGMDQVLNKKFGTSTDYPPTGWPDDVNLMGPLEEKTVSGAIASFSDGADDVPIKSASFGIIASGGGGTPSTPIPIVGKSSVTVYQTGKNMFPAPTVGTYTHRWLTATVTSDGKITLSGTNTNSQNATINIPLENPIDISKTVYIHLRNTGSNNSITVNFGSGSKSIAPINRIYSETPTTGCDYITIYAATSVSDANFEMQISFETTNETTAYEAYKAKTPITVSLGQTVYGGTIDNDGTLTLTWTKKLGNELSWSRHGSGYFYAVNANTGKASGQQNILSNVLVTTTTSAMTTTDYCICGRNQDGNIYVRLLGTETLTDFETWIADKEIAYELATPIVITGLDEISLSTYLGDNSIWCDSGDSEVTYRSAGTIQQYPNAEEATF